ncbi:hypothetical protein N510_001705 [Firmicutes bacterium ASF500]|jgi:transcriptional regulator with XRE-family HTH domain|nr:hypothetical protein N510_001705 [Firmicutes bacterium ASF500]
MLKLSERLYSLRKERKLTQDSVAKELGISMKSYCRYEKNEREPTASLLVEMAMLYHVSLDYLVGLKDERQ